jgi:alkanesulfonate monooxygenase SsuD/methylene tetrahydromethanopterin reductase-like flavin-dependent oxidoreductase (luciferase family)
MTGVAAVGVTLQGPVETLAGTARELEQAGAAALWVGDYFQSGLVRAAIVGAATTAVSVGTHVLQAFARSPLATALAAQELQDLTRGRFRLGLGSQLPDANRRWHGVVVERPVAALREYVAAVRMLLHTPAGEPAEFAGTYASYRVPPFRTIPAAAAPPVWIGAFGPRSTLLAAETADGLAGHLLWTDDHFGASVLPALQARPIPVSIARLVAPRTTPGARADLVRRLAHYLVTPAYQSGLRAQGIDIDRVALFDAIRTRDGAAVERISTRHVPAFCIEDADDLARHREQCGSHGVAQLNLLAPVDPAMPARTGELERAIVDLLRRAE